MRRLCDPGACVAAQVVGQLDKVKRGLNVVAYSVYQRLELVRGNEAPKRDWKRELGELSKED